jgi:nucleotide-binding universal stress UspA family protein
VEEDTMRKILIGISGKECSQSAVAFVAQQVRTGEDLEVTVAHVLPNLPAMFWDEGHILSAEEEQERRRVADTWMAKQQAKIEPLMQTALDSLASAGVPRGALKKQFISDSTDAADSLLEVARDGGQQLIVVSRCTGAEKGLSPAGGVPTKLLQKAAGVSVCIVD